MLLDNYRPITMAGVEGKLLWRILIIRIQGTDTAPHKLNPGLMGFIPGIGADETVLYVRHRIEKARSTGTP